MKIVSLVLPVVVNESALPIGPKTMVYTCNPGYQIIHVRFGPKK